LNIAGHPADSLQVELDLLVDGRLLTSGGSTLGPGGDTGPQIVARPPNLAVLLTHCGQLILRKISKFDATRCQISRLKCTKFDFRCGSAPDPAGELTALSQTP